MQEAIEGWEGERGALRQTTEETVVPRLVFSRGSPVATEKMMIGTANQVDWFDRVATALEGAAGKQPEQTRTETRAVIAILEDKQAEVMAQDQAGYFIREWQELRHQVRHMITRDSRYQIIRANRVAR
jgi:hypothetical protein